MSFVEFIYLAVALVTAITIHECAHAFVADRLGDPTPRVQGRLSLNPLAHLDPIGTLMMVIFHFGWGKPVVINPRYFRAPIRDSALVSLAGPATNFVCAFALALILKQGRFFIPVQLFALLDMILDVNLLLGIFNLLPFPPFDGSKIVGLFIPKRFERAYSTYLERGVIYVILFVLFDFVVLAPILGGSIIQRLVGVVFLAMKSVFFLV